MSNLAKINILLHKITLSLQNKITINGNEKIHNRIIRGTNAFGFLLS